MPLELVPLNVGDIIERFFKLFGRSFKRLAGLFLIVGIPAAIVMAVSVDSFFSSIIAIVSLAETNRTEPEAIGAIFRGLAFLGVGVFLLIVADVVLLVACQLVVCGEIIGRAIGIREAFELCSATRLSRAVGQRILGEMASGLSIVGPYLLIPLVIAFQGGAAMIGLVVLAFLIALSLFLYLRVRWAFGTTTIAWEEETVMGAFTRSGHLVSGNGWRLFGILAVFAIVVGLGLSILMTPFQLWAFKDLFLLGLQESARTVAQQAPMGPLEALAGVGFIYGLAAGAATLLQTVLKSIYLPILYFDLRARKGEFEVHPS